MWIDGPSRVGETADLWYGLRITLVDLGPSKRLRDWDHHHGREQVLSNPPSVINNWAIIVMANDRSSFTDTSLLDKNHPIS
jgi:hypothetical protein